MRAYEVNTIDGYGNERSESDTTSTATEGPRQNTSESQSTSTKSASKSASKTATSTPTTTESAEGPGDGSSLSGGAIAGIVIGVCAGVSIMAVFGFLAYRRRRSVGSSAAQLSSFVSEVDRTSPPPPPPKNTYSELDSTPATPVLPAPSANACCINTTCCFRTASRDCPSASAGERSTCNGSVHDSAHG